MHPQNKGNSTYSFVKSPSKISKRENIRKSRRSKKRLGREVVEDDLLPFLKKKPIVDTSRQIKGLIPVSAKQFYQPVVQENKMNARQSNERNDQGEGPNTPLEHPAHEVVQNETGVEQDPDKILVDLLSQILSTLTLDQNLEKEVVHHINDVGNTLAVELVDKKRGGKEILGAHESQVNQIETHSEPHPGKLHANNDSLANTITDSTNAYFYSQRDDFTVNYLLKASDLFKSKAHAVVLGTYSSHGQQEYFKLIKLSIQSLLMLLKDYKRLLSPHLELIICYKLAKIYYMETENISRADDYVNLAISISTRNHLYQIKFISEFLAAQIIQKTSIISNTNTSSLLTKYLDKRIDIFKSLNLSNYANLFQFLKISNLMVIDVATGLVMLQSICNDKSIDLGTRALCLLYQSSMQLYRGSPDQVVVLLDKVKGILDKNSFPIQLRAMYYLQLHLALIQTGRLKKSKKLMHDISKFLLQQQEKGWIGWNEDGAFNIIQSVELRDDDVNSISYQVLWMNSDEFVIMFYFLTGVNMLFESHNGKKKSIKVFNKCLDIIEKQLSQLTGLNQLNERKFSIRRLSKRIMKLKYLKNYINLYVNLPMSISLVNHTKNLSYLLSFLEKYKNREFSNEEIKYYQLLLPLLHYLLAINFQYEGNIQMAKKHYLEVCEQMSHKRPMKDSSVSMSQFDLGIGNYLLNSTGRFSELYVYSLIHLLVITEYEIICAATGSATASVGELHKFRKSIHENLTNAFSTNVNLSTNSFNDNFVNAYPHLQILYNMIINTYIPSSMATRNNSFEINNFENFDWEQFAIDFPIIGGIAYFISLTNTTDLSKRQEYIKKLEEILNEVSKTSPDGNLLKILLLQQQIESQTVFGDLDKVNVLKLQLNALIEVIRERTKIYI